MSIWHEAANELQADCDCIVMCADGGGVTPIEIERFMSAVAYLRNDQPLEAKAVLERLPQHLQECVSDAVWKFLYKEE